MELLKELSDINDSLAALTTRKTEIEAEVKSAVDRTGAPVSAYGLIARYKAGRKSTDHEAAAKAAGVPQDLVNRHSKTKVTVAWAKVTKDAKVDIAPYTIEGDPVFAIEAIEVV